MAKNKTTVPTFTYVVYTDNTCTVTDTATGLPLLTAYPGQPNYFTAYGDSVTLSDDSATILKPVFKCAPDALGLLVGGAKLPEGYTRLEFLESTGGQYIDTGLFGASADAYVNFHGETFSPGKRAFHVSGWGMSSPNTMMGLYAIVPKENLTNYFTGYIKGISLGQLNVTIKPERITINGKTYNQADFGSLENANGSINENNSLKLGAYSNGVSYADTWWSGKCYSFKAKLRNGSIDLVPVLDPSGSPCMYDTVSHNPHYNSGSGDFIAGVGTLAQLAALLKRLPATGGTLTLSLPAEANTPEVSDMMDAAAAVKGWILPVYEYRPAAAATYSLRRVREVVWCRKRQDENGGYVAASGTRWQVERCAAIFGRLGQDPAAYGYAPFDSVDAAAEHWQLVPYEAPEEETFNLE